MPKVADFFVEYSAKGLDEITRGIAAIGSGLTGLAAQAKKTGEALGDLAKRWKEAAEPLDPLARLAKDLAESYELLGLRAKEVFAPEGVTLMQRLAATLVGLGGAAQHTAGAAGTLGAAVRPVTSALWGWVQAGVEASGAGQVMGYQFRELSRQIASLFAPQVRWVIERLGDLIRWFQRLTGEQQANLRMWGLILGAIGVGAVVIPQIIASLKALGLALTAIRASLVGLQMVAMAHPLLALATALAAIFAAVVLATSDWKDVMASVASMSRAMAEPFQDMVKSLRQIVGLLREAREAMGGGGGEGVFSSATGFMRRHHERARQVNEWMPLPAIANLFGWKSGARGMSQFGALANPVSHVTAGALGFWQTVFGIKSSEVPGGTGGRDELAPRVGGLEQVEQTYRRIAEKSSLITGSMVKDPQQEALEELRRIYEDVRAIRDDQRRPLVVNR